MLAGVKHMVLVEAEPPVSFFGYPDKRSTMAPEDCEFMSCDYLEALADEFPALPDGWKWRPEGEPDGSVGGVMARLLPEGAIVSDEMVSAGEAVNAQLWHAARHDLLPVTGGSIGQGLPVAVGAAVACPGRKVISLEADGSAMYTLPALWTMARERLDVTVVVFANRRYKILDVEMARTGSGPIGPKADAMLSLRDPGLDFVSLARGMGVEAVRATAVEEFAELFAGAMKRRGPFVIEWVDG
jgi:acetolactate synthase-1/2/3 large subunit